MKFWGGDYLAHFGIKGQQWGVRRFQNEDGTLTEEGKRRYLKNFEDAEREADQTIERAKKQLADIDKNGWNAKSAFTKGFIDDMRREGMLDDENLKYFRQTFERDVESAMADKKASREGRDLINNFQNVTYDDVLNLGSKLDKEHKKLTENDYTRIDKYKKNIEEIGNELGLEKKKKETTSVELSYDSKTKKELESRYTKSEMKSIVGEIMRDIKKQTGSDFGSTKVNGKLFSELPVDQQFFILFAMFDKSN